MFCVFLEKGVAIVKGGPVEAVVVELQDTSAELTTQLVREACAVRL